MQLEDKLAIKPEKLSEHVGYLKNYMSMDKIFDPVADNKNDPPWG